MGLLCDWAAARSVFTALMSGSTPSGALTRRSPDTQRTPLWPLLLVAGVSVRSFYPLIIRTGGCRVARAPHCDAMRAPLRVLVVGALTRTGQQVARSLAARRDDFTVTALCGREMGGSARSEVPPPLRSGEGQGLGGPALPPPAPPPPRGLWTLRPAPPGWPCSGPLGRRVSQRWWWRPRAAEGGVAESAWRRFGGTLPHACGVRASGR